jgi:hypothetical protein
MLQTLPGLKGMRSLQELYIEWCEELRQLPDSISHLTELSRLILRGLPAMKALPEGLCGLKSLQVLNVKMCGIVSLSSRMQRLTALRNVELNDCEQLAALPAGLGQVPLDTLVLSSCGRLQSIQGNWKKVSCIGSGSSSSGFGAKACTRTLQPRWHGHAVSFPAAAKVLHH